jgi:hypothetical protein
MVFEVSVGVVRIVRSLVFEVGFLVVCFVRAIVVVIVSLRGVFVAFVAISFDVSTVLAIVLVVVFAVLVVTKFTTIMRSLRHIVSSARRCSTLSGSMAL